MNYHSVWVPGDLRWAVNPIQTGVIFASCDRAGGYRGPLFKTSKPLMKKKKKKKAKITQNNHFQKSNFFPKTGIMTLFAVIVASCCSIY